MARTKKNDVPENVLLARELKKNTEVMESMFTKFNLKVLQFSYKPSSDADYGCALFVELQAIEGDRIKNTVELKANLYDEYGEIIAADRTFIESSFYNYDTCYLFFDDKRALKVAKRARLFVTEF